MKWVVSPDSTIAQFPEFDGRKVVQEPTDIVDCYISNDTTWDECFEGFFPQLPLALHTSSCSIARVSFSSTTSTITVTSPHAMSGRSSPEFVQGMKLSSAIRPSAKKGLELTNCENTLTTSNLTHVHFPRNQNQHKGSK